MTQSGVGNNLSILKAAPLQAAGPECVQHIAGDMPFRGIAHRLPKLILMLHVPDVFNLAH